MKNFSIALALTVSSIGHAGECPDQPQDILVYDLKSGWWAGDGGSFADDLLSDLTATCSTITVEFHHYLIGNSQDKIFANGTSTPTDREPSKLAADYDQIWVLSGAEEDHVDLRVDSEEFLAISQHIQESAANLFVTGGRNNIYHANDLSSSLGLGEVFSRQSTDLVFNGPKE